VTNTNDQRPIQTQLLQMLRCPITLSKLTQDGDWLVSEVGGLRYPIRGGIPVMLPEEATLPEGVESLEEFKKRFARR
jgi:uncharacterized protein YbaR (Trm112 family)